MDRRPGRTRVAGLALVFVGIALLAHAGHLVFERSGLGFAHHVFHFAVGAGATLVVAGYIAHDVRQNGWPGFSWRLRPSPQRTHPEARGFSRPRH